MSIANMADRNAIENEMPWSERDVPKTLFQMLSRTAKKHPNGKAISYQIFSGPTDKAETLTWAELTDKVEQTANLFRSLRVSENDVVAFILPNCTETVLTLLGGAIAGIVNPINPLLEPEQIA